MFATPTTPTKIITPSRVWLGLVLILSLAALGGSLNPDPLRRFSPEGTVLYVSGGNRALAINEQGDRFKITPDSGTVKIESDNPNQAPTVFKDPLPNPTPYQNLRLRLQGSYGLMIRDNRAVWLTVTNKEGQRLTLRGPAPTEPAGIPTSHLPNSLLWLSPKNDAGPVKYEGRFDNPTDPEGVWLITGENLNAPEFLKSFTATLWPTKQNLELPDDSKATELIADPENIQTRDIQSPLGAAVIVDLKDSALPGVIEISPQEFLLFSDTRLLLNQPPLAIPNCPLTQIQNFTTQPFLLTGSNAKFSVVCVEF
ncbi:MAG: hypothetical protein V1821_04225 [bacterium]